MQVTEFINIKSELQQFTLLQGFSDDELSTLAQAFEEKIVPANEYLFHEGDSSSEVYFIRSGQVEVSRRIADGNQVQVLTILAAGDEVGELAVVDGSPRSASARTVEKTNLLVMNLQQLPITLMLLSRLVTNTTLVGIQKLRHQKSPSVEPTLSDIKCLDELRQFSLLNGLSETELKTLAQTLENQSLKTGEYLFRENEQSTDVYFIRSGRVEVCKPDSSGTEQVIASLTAGQEIGELALLDGAPRSASARVAEDGEAFALNTTRLPNNLMLLSRLISNLIPVSTNKLRQTNTEHVRSLERELKSVRLQNEFGHFFAYSVTLLTIGSIVNYLLNNYLQSVSVYTSAFLWGYLLILLIPTLILVRMMNIPLDSLGITWNNWQKSIREGVIASLILVVIFIGLLASLRYFAIIPYKPLNLSSIITIPDYAIHSYLQELIARGIIQSSFQRFFNDQQGGKSILLASFFFGLFHIHFGLEAVLIVFVSGIFFGAFYLRHHNLIGVTILHVALGTCALVTQIL